MSNVRVVEAYKGGNYKGNTLCKVATGAVALVLIYLLSRSFSSDNINGAITESGMQVKSAFSSLALPTNGKYIKALTWNVAAVNNNPFEYWITNDDPSYNALMKNVSSFIEHPGVRDLQVKQVFTPAMYNQLEDVMKKTGWVGVEKVRQYWTNEYMNRSIISGFIKDDVLGKKRLASMPDRVTNTINTADGTIAMRPTVINCYGGDIGTLAKWWPQWLKFFFEDDISVKKAGAVSKTKIFQMIPSISKAKYPAVTEEEEQISRPLQTMCMAIFDAILVHMMSVVGKDNWQPLRSDMCQKLNSKKNDRTVDILSLTYGEADIQFLQEVAGNFESFAKDKDVAQLFDIHRAASMDTDRDQNSFVLLKKGKFRDVTEVTDQVVSFYSEKNAGKKLPVVNGDLVVLTAVDVKDNTKYLLASFHGDTNGLATKPVLSAVQSFAVANQPDSKMLFGMDANTYSAPEADQQGVVDFGKFYTGLKLNSCYGPTPNPMNFTTFHARTHLQPQLNKAVSLEEKDAKGDKNPKDFIVFFAADFDVLATYKDNTGHRVYIENMVFPTLSFPSDHGITSTILKEVGVTKNLKGSA